MSTRPVATNALRCSLVKGSSRAACRAGSKASMGRSAASGASCLVPAQGHLRGRPGRRRGGGPFFRRLVLKNETKGRVWGGGCWRGARRPRAAGAAVACAWRPALHEGGPAHRYLQRCDIKMASSRGCLCVSAGTK